MAKVREKVVETLAEELHFPKEVILEQSLKIFLEKKLREIKTEIFQITGKYSISSAKEMEEKYKQGDLEEAGSWHDFHRLDHLEYKRDRLTKLLDELE